MRKKGSPERQGHARSHRARGVVLHGKDYRGLGRARRGDNDDLKRNPKFLFRVPDNSTRGAELDPFGK